MINHKQSMVYVETISLSQLIERINPYSQQLAKEIELLIITSTLLGHEIELRKVGHIYITTPKGAMGLFLEVFPEDKRVELTGSIGRDLVMDMNNKFKGPELININTMSDIERIIVTIKELQRII